MKAMVLAAGLGVRMRPLTLLRAKPVLPVLDRPLIAFTLERLARAGVRDVVVNLHHLPETVTEALGSGRRFGLRIRYAHEPQILGTGGGPRAVRDFFGKEPFLLVNGDMFFELDLRKLVSRHRASGAAATLALRRLPDPRAYSTVVTDRRGRILSIAGKPVPAEGTASMFAGVHVLDPRLLARLPEGASDSVRDLYVPLLAERGLLVGLRQGGAWYDFGRPALYRDAQLRMLRDRGKQQVLTGRGARIASSAVVRRAVVGARSRVAAGARVASSILWEDTLIEAGAHVTRAIVTAGGVVQAGERAAEVIVMPRASLGLEPGAQFEEHGEMAWVRIA
jgi:NDP-sugar pyrophosphorylase family protein